MQSSVFAAEFFGVPLLNRVFGQGVLEVVIASSNISFMKNGDSTFFGKDDI